MTGRDSLPTAESTSESTFSPAPHYDASGGAVSNFAAAFDWSLAPPGEKFLVAVSGGADSMALLWSLWQARRDLVAAHVNHGVRGADGDADAMFVRAHCEALQIPVVVERLAPRSRDEATLRALRYEALARLAEVQDCARVATGHTASDQLETVLLNWLRGAAVTGLRGIEPQRPLTSKVLLVRPLLAVTRDEAQQICRAAHWSWRHDASNDDPKYLRNRVRHELVPLLASLTNRPDAPPLLARQSARACEILRDDFAVLDELARARLADLTLRREPELLILDGARFCALPPSLQRRVLRAAVRNLQNEVRDLSSERLEAARRHIVQNGRRAVWQWRCGLSVEWTGAMAGNRIRLRVVKDKSAPS